MAASKRRRSAFDDDTDQVTDLPTIVVSPAVATTSKNKDTTVTSRSNYVAGERTPPRKSKRKLANGRASTTEPGTLTKSPAVARRVTRASSILRYPTSSRMPIGLAKGTRDILTTTKDALDSDEPLREEHRGTGKSKPPGFTLKKNRGRPRTIHLADEAAKVALMKQWANLRMSQGTLLSSTTGVSGLSDTTHSQELPSGGRPEVEIPPCEVVKLDKPPDFIPASDHIEPTCLWPSISSPDPVAEPLLEATVTNESIFTPALGFTTKDTSSERFPFSDDLQYPTSSPEIGQRVIEDFAPSQHANTGIVALPLSIIDGSPEIPNQPLQLLATDSEVMSLLPITGVMSELDVTLKSAEAEVPQTRDSPSAGDIQLLVSDVDDSILDFHMLDLPEVLSPWVPVSPTAPSIYVPPAVHHLLAGMKHQLEIQCQARKRAEELYLEEMRKRIGMEEIVDKLQKEKISTREQDVSPTARPFGTYKRRVAGQQDGAARASPSHSTHLKVTT